MRLRRIEEIQNYIYENKKVSLDELCEKFGVSKNTIRRDIEEIVAGGNIKKIYGGVCVQPDKELISFDERNIKGQLPKQIIAAKAAELVEDGDIIFIDSGTTTSHIIDHIRDKQNITIITNNLEIIVRAVPYDNINVISLSGALNRKTLSFTGQSAVNVLQGYNISKAFMASTGISIENGVTNFSPLECEIKQVAVQRSRQVYLLVDSSKFGVVSLMTYCSLDKINALITDKNPPANIADFFAEHNHKILIAGQR
jgi:Transcriptional regulators of sugar metabolism